MKQIENINIKPYADYDRGLFKSCYKDYSKELDQYSDTRIDDVTLDRNLDNLIDTPSVQIYLLYHDSIQIGFLIISKYPNCHPECSYYIQDFYIIPQFRRKGLGSNVIELYTRMFKGKYCLRILERNSAAYAFWAKIWKKIGAIDITQGLEDDTPDEMEFFAYKV